ncbi:MAG: glycosyltransferase family 2 protein [Ignavibacteriaceae bacterium]|nr:glycosyltransferase family 2 protein [Chlorobium sp.]MCW8817956.1 glycosyltransferase family 2 protein [Ignavibacteriaceae bacterium]MCW8824054.1 glycosyltransferase family 2 protein [Ignavibacteriaceae bacterium]MCW9094889.1 glycosyltransferase family 2 protein [Ignavibacteriaceae bacterium]MCW9096956.1 glycosyltransferase family 2 protein [Ignavibacteriaceae bacterium]
MSSLKEKNKNPGSICAVIPFYNEKETLIKILNETSHYVKFIYAVNDGSVDDSYQTERQISNVKFIDHDKNYGKGKALDTGFKAAVSSGYDYIVTLDADLQHNPKYIPNLIEGLKSFDIVIGNRLINLKGMPIQRKLSNKLTSFFLTIKIGQNILDSQCGYRAYSVKVLKEVATEYSGFEAESEILVKASKKGFKIGFVDIPTIYGNEKSKMQPVQAILGFLKVMLNRS